MTTSETTIQPLPYQGTPGRNTGLRFTAMLAGEAATAGAEYGVLSVLPLVDQAFPSATGAIKGALCSVVRYAQKPIEACMQYGKGIIGERNYNWCMSQDRDTRCAIIGDAVYRYGLALGAGFGAFYVAMPAASRALGISVTKKDTLSFLGTDSLVHMGTLVTLTLPGIAPLTSKVKERVSAGYQGLGVDKHRADDFATMNLFSMFPNATALAAVTHKMYQLEKQLQKSALQLG